MVHIKDINPPSGTYHTLKFKIKNLNYTIPIIELTYHKDINTPINGGKLTTPLDSKLYKKLRVNQSFELWWGWKTQLVKVMTGYLTHIQTENNNIEIEFVDRGALLRKNNKLKYKKRHRLKIIADIIQHSKLNHKIDWKGINSDTIDYDGGTQEIQGKSYENMLQELLEDSAEDLVTIIKENTCKILNIPKLPHENILPIHEDFNIVKGSVSISEVSSELINHITIYFKDDKRKNRITCADNKSIKLFGLKHESIEETWISNAAHAKKYVVKLLRKNIRENGFQIDLSVIASPYYDLLQSCHVKITKYNVDHVLRINSLNLKISAGKAPVMDLCLKDYTPAKISMVRKK